MCAIGQTLDFNFQDLFLGRVTSFHLSVPLPWPGYRFRQKSARGIPMPKMAENPTENRGSKRVSNRLKVPKTRGSASSGRK
jgi:hypothetical protein